MATKTKDELHNNTQPQGNVPQPNLNSNQPDHSAFYGTNYPVDAYGNPYPSNNNNGLGTADTSQGRNTRQSTPRNNNTQPQGNVPQPDLNSNQPDYSAFYGTDYPVDAYGNPYPNSGGGGSSYHSGGGFSGRGGSFDTSGDGSSYHSGGGFSGSSGSFGDPSLYDGDVSGVDPNKSGTDSDGIPFQLKMAMQAYEKAKANGDTGDKTLADYLQYYYGNGGDGSGGSGSGGSGQQYSIEQLLSQWLEQSGANPNPYNLPDLPGANPERLEHVDTAELENMVRQLIEAQRQQGGLQIDRAVEQGTLALKRALEDAAPQFQTQRNQAAAAEAQALDNQALYAEARGDRGGIGAAQYASIQNTAATNERAINDAQVKLGTDTARQIEDLRSQGEFQKADQLLTLAQSELSQLMQLKQWAMNANIGIDQFNSQLQQWADEFELKRQQLLADLDLSQAQLTGVFADGTKTASYLQQLNSSLASSGSALLNAGIMPSRQQLEAMGLTETQAKAYLAKQP